VSTLRPGAIQAGSIIKSFASILCPYLVTPFFDDVCQKDHFLHTGEPEVVYLRGIMIPDGIGEERPDG
jgi:hypothetical protein